MNRRIIAGVLLFVCCLGGRAEVRPHPLFSDGAVLQREMPIPVWGSAEKGESVAVTFDGQRVETVARDGRWLVRLKPHKAGGPFTLTIAGRNTVVVTNVLVGEVWLCSGQSNMQFALSRAANGAAAIEAADEPLIRLLTVPQRAADKPTSEVPVAWKTCSPESARTFSAVGYFFGRDLRRRLGVPIGLICSSWGGTPAEAWTDRETLSHVPELRAILERQAKAEAAFDPARFAAKNKQIAEQYEQAVAKAKAEGRPRPSGPRLDLAPQDNHRRPCALYNGMIAPLQPYAFRGVIWYQGESNNGDPTGYRKLFPAMIDAWRKAWGTGDFPFLFVQIAPHKGMSPALREAQLQVWRQTPRTAMAVITDVGDAEDIHPTRKEPASASRAPTGSLRVGARLALAARALAYGDPVVYSGPLFDTLRIDGSRAVVSFKHCGAGLEAKDGPLKGFTIAGADGQFVSAGAEIAGDTVVVSSEQVPRPVAVRYGWANVPDVNLFNRDGLPASPFRTGP